MGGATSRYRSAQTRSPGPSCNPPFQSYGVNQSFSPEFQLRRHSKRHRAYFAGNAGHVCNSSDADQHEYSDYYTGNNSDNGRVWDERNRDQSQPPVPTRPGEPSIDNGKRRVCLYAVGRLFPEQAARQMASSPTFRTPTSVPTSRRSLTEVHSHSMRLSFAIRRARIIPTSSASRFPSLSFLARRLEATAGAHSGFRLRRGLYRSGWCKEEATLLDR